MYINKDEVYLIENKKQRVQQMAVIKRYILFMLLNIVKTGSKQIEKMSFSFFSCLISHSKWEKKFFSVIG